MKHPLQILILSGVTSISGFGQSGSPSSSAPSAQLRASFTFTFETRAPGHDSRGPWKGFSEREKAVFRQRGKSDSEIAAFEARMAELRKQSQLEQRRRGTLVVRRYGRVVAMEKAEESAKRGDGAWSAVGPTDEEKSFFGETPGVAVSRDYSDSKLVTSIGAWGPGGQQAGDIDRMEGYSFPHTVGNGILSVPLAGVPLSNAIGQHRLVDVGDGRVGAQFAMKRGGVNWDVALQVQRESGVLVRYEERNGGRLAYAVTTEDIRTLENGMRFPGLVTVQVFDSTGEGKLHEAAYRFRTAAFGDAVNIDDMPGLGPTGTDVRDHRLHGLQSVPYKLGNEPLSDEQVESLSKKMDLPKLEQSGNPAQTAIGVGGCVFIGLGAYLIARKRRAN